MSATRRPSLSRCRYSPGSRDNQAYPSCLVGLPHSRCRWLQASRSPRGQVAPSADARSARPRRVSVRRLVYDRASRPGHPNLWQIFADPEKMLGTNRVSRIAWTSSAKPSGSGVALRDEATSAAIVTDCSLLPAYARPHAPRVALPRRPGGVSNLLSSCQEPWSVI